MILLLSGDRAHAEIAGPRRIIDGRTLEVAGQRIRLFGIDAPDLDQVCEHGGRPYQCGSVARAALWDLIAGLDVACAPEAEEPGSGGSTLAICTAGGRSLNESVVRAGWALADRGATDRYVARPRPRPRTRAVGCGEACSSRPGSGGRRRRRTMRQTLPSTADRIASRRDGI
jgi:endonuclease YncB( thermonuclease family)